MKYAKYQKVGTSRWLLILVYLLCQILTSTGQQLENNLTSEVRCRTERGFALAIEAYKLDTCARCYAYLPLFAFVAPECRLRYDPRSGLLYDVRRNFTVLADPDNATQLIYGTFQSDLFIRKWVHCCKAAMECCNKMHTDPPASDDAVVCPRTWDGWQCWPDTPGGETASSLCQDHVYFMSGRPPCPKYVIKKCWSNGTWHMEWNKEWSNYSFCGQMEGMKRLQIFHIASSGVSIFFLLPALFIFSTYKQLQVHRITLHKNLFAALLMNAALTIAFRATVAMDEINHSGVGRTIMEENTVSCRLLSIAAKYSRMCTYMWMFCEGFYLHKLIAAAFAEQKSLRMFYFIGWVFPIFPVSTLALLRWHYADEQCWIVPVEPYEWVTNSLNLLSLLMNFAFLCNIIRVLVTKLRATHTKEPSQFRKAVRATLVLIPLFGVHFFFVMYNPKQGECTFMEAYRYVNYAMEGLQGFLVSLIFCYLNGEVIDLIRRSMYRFRLRYSLDVHPTSITTTASELSSGSRCRQASDYSADGRVRKSVPNFSQKNETELETLNQVHQRDFKGTAETSLIVQE